jgi:hypothetical protein
MGSAQDDTTLYGNSLRMLYILDAAGAPVVGRPPVPTAIKVLDSQKRLSALHFWMRNPDHLVAALLLKVEEGDRDLLEVVQRILDQREPELRRVPMQKYLRGAWEPVDTSMAVLVTNGLAYYERVKAEPGDKTLKHIYYLLQSGHDLAARMAEEEPELDWYRQRAELVTAIGPDATGSDLKDLQYLVPEYARAKMGAPIGSIADRVRREYARIAAELGK